MTPLRPAKAFDWRNLGLRALSTAVLAPVVLAAVWFGDWAFLLVLSVAVALLAIEWSLMSAPEAPARVAIAVAAAILAAIFTSYLGHYRVAWIVAALCAAVGALAARSVTRRPTDAAFGVLYIGAPALCLTWLRSQPLGRDWVFLLLAVTWSADILAFVVGNALGGPKLWPRFSPNKTWSGFIGGLAGAGAAAILFSLKVKIGLGLPAAALIGLLGGLATMAGDLWESMLKRRFGVKDSGDLIPGHGGLLDRVDGLMFAILAVSIARLALEIGWPG